EAVLFDLDGDGVEDVWLLGRDIRDVPTRTALVCCSGRDGHVLFRGNPPGTQARWDLAFDRPGRALYLTSSPGVFRFRLDTREFEPCLTFPMDSANAVVLADGNGDGRLDAIFSCENNLVVAYDLTTGQRLW